MDTENINWKNLNREERGLLISQTFRIEKTESGWKVPSQSGGGSYLVKFNGHNSYCNCPDCKMRKQKCKHIHAVEFYLKQEIDKKGKIKKQTKGVKIHYSQNWKAYDQSQVNEKIVFSFINYIYSYSKCVCSTADNL